MYEGANERSAIFKFDCRLFDPESTVTNARRVGEEHGAEWSRFGEK